MTDLAVLDWEGFFAFIHHWHNHELIPDTQLKKPCSCSRAVCIWRLCKLDCIQKNTSGDGITYEQSIWLSITIHSFSVEQPTQVSVNNIELYQSSAWYCRKVNSEDAVILSLPLSGSQIYTGKKCMLYIKCTLLLSSYYKQEQRMDALLNCQTGSC